MAEHELHDYYHNPIIKTLIPQFIHNSNTLRDIDLCRWRKKT